MVEEHVESNVGFRPLSKASGRILLNGMYKASIPKIVSHDLECYIVCCRVRLQDKTPSRTTKSTSANIPP